MYIPEIILLFSKYDRSVETLCLTEALNSLRFHKIHHHPNIWQSCILLLHLQYLGVKLYFLNNSFLVQKLFSLCLLLLISKQSVFLNNRSIILFNNPFLTLLWLDCRLCSPIVTLGFAFQFLKCHCYRFLCQCQAFKNFYFELYNLKSLFYFVFPINIFLPLTKPNCFAI